METENEIAGSLKKLHDKKLDFIVLNNPLKAGAGFEVDTNMVTILDSSGGREDVPLMNKKEVAERILDRIAQCLSATRQN